MLTIVLPDLINTCPFEQKFNPEYAAVVTETENWLQSFQIPYDEVEAKYALWSALTFPESSRSRLRDASDVWTLLFLADDIMDNFFSSDSDGFSKRTLFQNMSECLQPSGNFQPLTPFAAALHDWWQRIRLNATEDSQKRLISSYKQSNEASLRQAKNRVNHEPVPSLEDYIKARRDTSYGRVVCYFVDYSLDLRIPGQCWSNEIFLSLIDCTTDAAAWTNDIYSFNLEQARGDYNLVTILCNGMSLDDLQKAMNQAGDMVIEKYAEFQRLREQLPSWGEDIDEQVKRYVDALSSGIIANVMWSFLTPRYFGKSLEIVKKTQQIEIFIKTEPSSDIFKVAETMNEDENQEISNDQYMGSTIHDGDDTDSDYSSDLMSNTSVDCDKISQENQSINDIEFMGDILSPYTYIDSLSGKKVRSKLIAALNYWFRVPQEKIMIIDEVIGMLHNASLLIDDIEDGSELRRGARAAHTIYGVPLTINAAELTCFIAMQKAMELGHPHVPRVMIENLIELHKGQGIDIFWRDNHICPSEQDYEQMVSRKCGGLFMLIVDLLKLSSTVHVSDDEMQLINQICNGLALLFQIRDDYSNLVSREYAENKSFCEDLTEGKYSFVVIHAIRKYPEDDRIENILKKRTRDIECKREALQLFYHFGSLHYARERCFELAKRCNGLINELNGNVFLKMILTQLMLTLNSTVEETLYDLFPLSA